jgi:hypothetical protein
MPLSLRTLLAPLGLAPREKHAATSYAQEGEDMILRRVFARKKRGFYVDVGAHHPKRFSNTYAFYLRGWSGLNIDAMPGAMRSFERLRPRDINVEAAIALEPTELTYFVFNDAALNTFDEALARRRAVGEYRIVETRRIAARPLKDVLSDRLPPGTAIDFMSIDVEGLDLDVARSNDWSRFRPGIVLVESYGERLEDDLASDLSRFLTGMGYRPFAKTVYTLFFRDGTASAPGAPAAEPGRAGRP